MKDKKTLIPQPALDYDNKSKTWKAGYDSVISGPNKVNCHFTLFGDQECTKDWDAGAEAAKRVMKNYETIADVLDTLASHPDNLKVCIDPHHLQATAGRTCRVCGCSQFDACYDPNLGNCWWVEIDLCSHCQKIPGKAVRYSQMTSQ